jgi:hypothetical protein
LASGKKAALSSRLKRLEDEIADLRAEWKDYSPTTRVVGEKVIHTGSRDEYWSPGSQGTEEAIPITETYFDPRFVVLLGHKKCSQTC